MLQREHPGIAISVKTRQAIRTILNNARDVIQELKGGGLLDEAEAGKLESVKHSLPCVHKTEINAVNTCLVIFVVLQKDVIPHAHAIPISPGCWQLIFLSSGHK